MLNPSQQERFRTHLRGELIRRCKENPSYSLRAYARALGVQSSFLSKLLNGKRAITLKTITRFAEPLGLPPEELAPLSGKSEEKSEKSRLASLEADVFQTISDWYHFAILELFTVQGFRPTPKEISKRLGLTQMEASDALLRLTRLGFIKRDEKRGYRVCQGESTTLSIPGTNAALQKLQKQVLQKALYALENTPIHLRDQSTMTMAIDSRRLPEAKERIKKFRRSLCDFLQTEKTRDSVYHLTISLYPVTKERS